MCFLQIGCAGLAFQRFKSGTSAAFTEGIGEYDANIPDGQYQSYPGGQEDGNFQEPPFAQQGTADFARFWVDFSETEPNKKMSSFF